MNMHAALRGTLLSLALGASIAANAAEPVDMAAVGQRIARGEGQEALQPLVGRWKVTKEVYAVIGTPDKPAKSSGMTTERHWMPGRNFLVDTTVGKVDGKPYFRSGFLGYDTVEKRYDWTTADNQTPLQMRYSAKAGSGPGLPTSMVGAWADPGVGGEAHVGQPIPMRTTIEVVGPDRHVYSIYFTLPGQAEMLADRMVFDRIRPGSASRSAAR